MSRVDKRLLGIVFAVSLAWALIASHGVALWDDDYAGWFRYALPKSIPRLIFEWISPIPTRTEGWAFQNRPAQALIYKLIHAIFGYRAAAYFALKSVFWAGLVTMNCAWVLRVGRSRVAALLPAVLLLASPSVMASFIWHADYGLLAECALAGALFWCFTLWEIDTKRFDVKWILVFVVIYLGYGTKAHVKCIPVVLLAYQAIFVPKERRIYGLPLVLLALAIPWSPKLLSETAPFLPGSGGSPTRWMTQAWSARRMLAHVASGFSLWPRELPHSLVEELGPTLPFLILLAGALFWRRKELAPPVVRALGLVTLWLVAVLAVTGALPDLPSFFSVRYGLILLSPVSVLAGLALSQLTWRWQLYPSVAALAATLWCNGALSIGYRDSLGSVTRSVDQAYAFVESRPERTPLLLLPGFLSFDYQAESSLSARRRPVASVAEAEGLAQLHPWALGWQPVFSERLGLVRRFDGCAGFAIVRADCNLRAYLYRVGDGPQPDAPSLLARFQEGLAAEAAGDHARFLAVFETLDRDAPTVQVRYNYALALQRNRRFDAAVREWKRLIDEGVRDPGTLTNALESAQALPDPAFARRLGTLPSHPSR